MPRKEFVTLVEKLKILYIEVLEVVIFFWQDNWLGEASIDTLVSTHYTYSFKDKQLFKDGS